MDGWVPIRTLRSGVPGFDDELGRGIPEFSSALIVGDPAVARPRWGIKSCSPTQLPSAKRAVIDSLSGSS